MSDKKIALANCYLYQVLAAEYNRLVVNVYGHQWAPFAPLLDLVEQQAKLEDVAAFRKKICEQFNQGRMDFLYERLDSTFESLLESFASQVSQYVTLFPSPPPLQGGK